jgi:hypothetical protein
LERFRYYQRLIAEVDKEIASRLQALETSPEAEAAPPTRTKKRHYQRQHYEPTSFDLRGELYRIFGVDLTEVPGIGAVTAHTILCEIGPHLSAFRNASAFLGIGLLVGFMPGEANQRRQGPVHKLARIVFHLLTTKEAYQESVFTRCEEEAQKRAELRLRRHAAKLGFQVIPAANL